MAKFKVEIKRVETYSYRVIVEAENATKAKKAVEAEWNKDDYLYEKVLDSVDDTRTTISKGVKATDEDIQLFPRL